MTHHGHIDKHYDAEISQLEERVVAMGTLVGLQIRAAIAAFAERDLAQVAVVERDDHAINELERSIDERCISLLALHQPAASDLRLVAAVLVIGALALGRLGPGAERWKAAADPVELPRTR